MSPAVRATLVLAGAGIVARPDAEVVRPGCACVGLRRLAASPRGIWGPPPPVPASPHLSAEDREALGNYSRRWGFRSSHLASRTEPGHPRI